MKISTQQAIETLERFQNPEPWEPKITDRAYEALQMAISALEKQEQTNAQNVNSTHRSCPNALESLNILEQAKDDKGCVPMSLVRQAFRNVMEQDRWIPATERLPEYGQVVIWCNENGSVFSSAITYKHGDDWAIGKRHRYKSVLAWKPLPEPYKAEEEA